MVYEKNKGTCVLIWIILLGTIGVAIAALVIALDNQKKIKKESLEDIDETCSGNAKFPFSKYNTCVCKPGWGGIDCSIDLHPYPNYCKPPHGKWSDANKWCECQSIDWQGGPSCNIKEGGYCPTIAGIPPPGNKMHCRVGYNGKCCSGPDQGVCHTEQPTSGNCACKGGWTATYSPYKFISGIPNCSRCDPKGWKLTKDGKCVTTSGCPVGGFMGKVCNGGTCKDGKCTCIPGWEGPACDSYKGKCPLGGITQEICSGHGTCDQSTGVCSCDTCFKQTKAGKKSLDCSYCDLQGDYNCLINIC